MNLKGFRQPKKGLWRIDFAQFQSLVPDTPRLNISWKAIGLALVGVVVGRLLHIDWSALSFPLFGMAILPYYQANEPAIGANHPTWTDSINRPLREFLRNAGLNPDSTNISVPSFSQTVNAGSNAFSGTKEARITAAVALAVSLGWTAVYIPIKAWDGLSMLPYNASLVTFNTAVRMTREGGSAYDYDVQAYGAAGNAVTLDHVAIQAAIDGSRFGSNPSAAGFNGRVFFPAGTYMTGATLNLYNATHLTGLIGAPATDYPFCELRASASFAAAMVEMGNGTDINIDNLMFKGNLNAGCKGIHGGTCNTLVIQNVGLNTFGDRAIHVTGGAGAYYTNIFISAALRTPGALVDYAGAFDINGADILCSNVYADCGIFGAAQGAGSGFICGIAWAGFHGSFVSCEGDGAQTGIAVIHAEGQTRFVNCRSNLTQRNGWEIVGNNNQFSNCYAFDASLNAANTWDGFVFQAGAIGNGITSCAIGATLAGQVRHGITDLSVPVNEADFNYYVGNKTLGAGVAGNLYNLAGNRGSVLHPRRLESRGDVAPTLTPRLDAEIQVFNSPLTANRIVSLSATGGFNGCRFMIIRTAAATGAFQLIVQGAINVAQNLAIGQWILVEWNWAFTAFVKVATGTVGVAVPVVPLTFNATLATDASLGNAFTDTLTANVTAVSAPTNPTNGQRITYTFIQDGTGGRTVAGWNAVFKQSWVDTGNTLGKRSSISFVYDGTNWNQDGAQTPYV